MITKRQFEALTILKDTKTHNGIYPRDFADRFWPNIVMHTAVKNTGNGACKGKAAWLCAGGYMAKLAKKGLVYCNHHPHVEYWITSKGREELEKYNKSV